VLYDGFTTQKLFIFMKNYYKQTILSLCLSLSLLTACSSPEQRAFKAALSSAEKGDVIAQMKVADLYFAGTGTEKNIDESVHWYHKAAQQANPQAFSWLMGQAYKGNQVAAKVIHDMQNEGNIFLAHWVLESAKQSNAPNAQYAVAWMYDTGKGLIKDPHQARIWYEKAAKQNNVLAIKALGNQHYFGEIEQSSNAKATEYLTYAAEKGKDADAAMKMAHYYHYDVRDAEMARQWYVKAGALGDADSQRMADTYDEWKNTGPLQPNDPPAGSQHEE
jgi:TPR repeat protein